MIKITVNLIPMYLIYFSFCFNFLILLVCNININTVSVKLCARK